MISSTKFVACKRNQAWFTGALTDILLACYRSWLWHLANLQKGISDTRPPYESFVWCCLSYCDVYHQLLCVIVQRSTAEIEMIKPLAHVTTGEDLRTSCLLLHLQSNWIFISILLTSLVSIQTGFSLNSIVWIKWFWPGLYFKKFWSLFRNSCLDFTSKKDERVENANRHLFYFLIWDQKVNQLMVLSLFGMRCI